MHLSLGNYKAMHAIKIWERTRRKSWDSGNKWAKERDERINHEDKRDLVWAPRSDERHSEALGKISFKDVLTWKIQDVCDELRRGYNWECCLGHTTGENKHNETQANEQTKIIIKSRDKRRNSAMGSPWLRREYWNVSHVDVTLNMSNKSCDMGGCEDRNMNVSSVVKKR